MESNIERLIRINLLPAGGYLTDQELAELSAWEMNTYELVDEDYSDMVELIYLT